MKIRRRYEICLEECFYGFTRVVYNLVLDYAIMETFELCSGWENVARRWDNRSETVGDIGEESAEGSMFLVEEKDIVPRRPLRLA